MPDEQTILVTVFLRGGLDGLSAVVPVFEEEYFRRRPTLTVSPAKAGTAGAPMLDRRFALHPGLTALLPAWREGRLAVVHAVGSDDRTRSHFEAQDQVEHGATAERPLAGGWIGRWLRSAGETHPLAALAFGRALPEALRGAPAACAVESLEELALRTLTGDPRGFAGALAELAAQGVADRPGTLVREGSRNALALLGRIEGLLAGDPGGDFPRTGLGRALSQASRVVRAGVGLRAVAVDHGGFDTHYAQPLALEGRLVELAEALAAFEADLGEARARVTTVCVTEFGRRVYENASVGTDHGRASCAFVLGEGLRGGEVLGRWPGVGEGELEGPGDLAVTTDYRDLLWELLSGALGAGDVGAVFPGLEPRPVGLFV